MKPPSPGNQNGFVLPIVVVFVVVLSLTAYLVSHLTRTNIQVVNNIENEKAAFYIAEAGATEALIRLRISATPNVVTVDGRTFNPDIVPVTGTPWNWRANITFAPTLPVPGTTFTTPTIQPDDPGRLPYSHDVVGDPDKPVLNVAWEMDGSKPRQIAGRNVVRITSTGRSGNARRTVVVHAIPAAAAGCTLGGICTLSTDCNAVALSGNATVSLDETCGGGMAINSACDPCALDMSSSSRTSLDVPGGIDVVGGWCGNVEPEPPPNTGAEEFTDPLADLPELQNLVCDYTATTKLTADVNNDGRVVYCGGLRLGANDTVPFPSGNYVIAGGVLDVSGTASVSGSGVTFHVARHPTTGQWGTVDFGPGTSNLAAPTDPSNPYNGVLIYQYRGNANELRIRGTFNTGLNGIIYAPSANVSLQNQTNPAKDLDISLIVGSVSFMGDNSLGCPAAGNPTLVKKGFKPVAWKDWPS